MNLVTIIIPNYNKGKAVRHSLNGLIMQTCAEWEAVVVDDCSSDESWAIIQEYVALDARIVAIRNEVNKGGNYCRNLGVKMAKGKYLVFLDSDDWLSNDCLEVRLREFERDENADVDMLIFPMKSTKDGKGGIIWNYGDRRNALISFLRHEIPWSIMMPIWRKEAFGRVGGFDEALPRLQDVELHTRALLMGLKYKFAERVSPDCFYYVEESRMTTNYEKSACNFVNAVELYIDKTVKLIRNVSLNEVEKRHLLSALQETRLATIRSVGDLYQATKIDKLLRNVLWDCELLKGSAFLLNAYAFFYKIRLNKIKGFNLFYKWLIRIINI